MQVSATNFDIARIQSMEFIDHPKLHSNERVGAWTAKVSLLISPEDFIGLEFSLVPEIESVFVDKARNGKELRVMVVTNERDQNVRAKVYARERAIIDEFENLDFDFHVIARMNRDLGDITSNMGKLVFKR